MRRTDPDFASISPNSDSAKNTTQIQGLKAIDRLFAARFLQDEDSDEGVEFVRQKIAEEKFEFSYILNKNP